MTAQTSPTTPRSRPEIVSLGELELPEIAGFLAAQSGRSREAVDSHLRWFVLENPARKSADAVGVGLRSAGRLVGCMLCSPQTFQFQSRRIEVMGSSSLYVDGDFRGHGGRIFLQFCRMGNRMPIFGTSANPEAAALWKAAGASPFPDADGEWFGVLDWPPVAEEFAHRKCSHPAITRLARTSLANLAGVLHPLKLDAGQATLVPLTFAAEAADLLAKCPDPPNGGSRITALRELPYLHWRYFSGRDDSAAAFVFQSSPLSQPVFVAVNRRDRGYRSQIKALNLLDVYPEVQAETCLQITAALAGLYRRTVHAIVLRNQRVERRPLFAARGFRWRAFDAPTGWYLDRARLLPHADWHVVPADGDALI
jgi:hypothetical protein